MKNLVKNILFSVLMMFTSFNILSCDFVAIKDLEQGEKEYLNAGNYSDYISVKLSYKFHKPFLEKTYNGYTIKLSSTGSPSLVYVDVHITLDIHWEILTDNGNWLKKNYTSYLSVDKYGTSFDNYDMEVEFESYHKPTMKVTSISGFVTKKDN